MAADVVLRVVELSAPNWQQQERASLHSEPLKTVLDWLFETKQFDCAVVAPRSGILQRHGWPRVLLAEYNRPSERAILERAAQSGFRLVIGTRGGRQELTECFERVGYRVSGEGIYGTGDRHDPLRPASNAGALEQTVAIASRLCRNTLCLFGHDADPVYLLLDESSEGTFR